MSAKKTYFNPDWEDPSLNPQWSPWLHAVEGFPDRARCTFCQKIIYLSNMGRQAISSHTRCRKHKKMIKRKTDSENIKSIFRTRNCEGSFSSSVSNADSKSPSQNVDTDSSSLVPNDESSQKSDNSSSLVSNAGSSQKSDIKSFFTKDNVLSAELVWAMKLVSSHSSYNSFDDAALIFQRMFDDSNKAKALTLGRTKMAYLISFGLAPYFKDILINNLKNTEYVICFDEALNRIIQRGQMDLFVRFWDNVKQQVSTRYLSSLFLGHATANDLLKAFFEGISDLDKNKLLQVSLDGPNVNKKFLRDLKDNLASEDSCHLLDIGSCGLHVVHGAFRAGHGATGWHLNELFKDIHRIFKDSPARRADYISITENSKFPLKFCDVRWCENITVAERIIEIFPHIKKFMKESNLPETVSVDRVKHAISDKLILSKISFFITVNSVLYPFLKSFQSAEPQCPFLYSAFHGMLNQLLSKFIKKEVLEKVKTPEKLIKIDVTDSNNYSTVAEVDIGIAAGAILAKSSATDSQKREFRLACRAFLVKLTAKIIERSPFKYYLVRYMSSLDPKFIVSNETLSEKRMEHLLHTLYENEWVNSTTADKAKMQFKQLLFRSKGIWKENFTSYTSERLDHFYRDLLNSEDFNELWKVIKLILILSHGNATVESGFSVNKDMLVENLQEKSLVALRTVYDAIKENGGVLNVTLTPHMLKYARSARSAYHQALEVQKMLANENKKIVSDKLKAKAQIKVLQSKKQKLSHDVSVEMTSIDAQIAELKRNM